MFWRKKQAKSLASEPNSVDRPNSTVIPADSIARLMYYLHCVKVCVDFDLSPRLTTFSDWYLLSESEKRDVVITAHRFRPAVLRSVLFFEAEDRNYLLSGTVNNFLDFTDPVVIGSFNLYSNAITVDGAQYIIRKVMVFRHCWMDDYYFIPFETEKWRIGLNPRPTYFVNSSESRNPYATAADIPLWYASGIVCCFFFPFVGLALLLVGGCRLACEVARYDYQPYTTTYVVF